MATHSIRTATTLLLPLMLLILSPFANGTAGAQLDNIMFQLYYELPRNTGLMTVKFHVNTSGDVLALDVPVTIFESGVLECLNYTATPGLLVLGFDFDEELGVLKLLVLGSGILEVLFSVEGVFSELVSEYSITIDTTLLRDIANTATVELYVTGVYEVYITRFYGAATTRWYIEGNTTKVEVAGFTWLEVVLKLELAITTPPETSVIESKVDERTNIPVHLLVLGALATALSAGAAFYLYRYLRGRSPGLTVEFIDYFKDSSARQILLALGEASEHGLTQSEIARNTGLPKSTVSRKLRRLMEDGVVEVKHSGKYNYVVLTPKGQSLYKKLKEEAERK